VTATDGINSSTQSVSITVLDVDDESPVFTSPSAFRVPENQTSIGEITATDVDSESISFSVDGDELAITAEGTLSFVTAPDYETKNAYSGVVTATDGTNSATMEITIAIEDVDDPPVITSIATFSAPENQTAVGTVTATDVDSEVLIFSLDSDQLNITSDGVLSFVNAPDYEVLTNYIATVEALLVPQM
jgi:serralysin